MWPGDSWALEKELASYDAIRASQLPASVRISRLLGLVREESETVFGLLFKYIDCDDQTLTVAVHPGTSESLRQQWIAETTEIVHCLHQEGVVWGDAKPSNVLIDQGNHAWVIDFGGGDTEGWVPKELAGTIEGDLVAMKKTVDYVGRGSATVHKVSISRR